MSRKDLIVLFILGIGLASVVAWLQESPGYMDADYYMAGGLRLVQGHGFSEIILWNYLDDPQGLPHPSHSYWMPLASILAAFGMWLTGQHDFFSARIPFILLAGLIPVLTGLLAHRLTNRRELALISGLLAAFPAYNAVYLATTDNFVLYPLLGAFFFLTLLNLSTRNVFFLGLIAGLMNLSRADGLLWLGLAFVAVVFSLHNHHAFRFRKWFWPLLFSSVLIFAGYFLVMGPWFVRNIEVFGTPIAPGGSSAALLVEYGDTFHYPASALTLDRWLSSGTPSIFQVRFEAFLLNLGTTFAVQGGIMLLPFILIAAYRFRTDLIVRVAFLGWATLFCLLTIIFPFAGFRGSFLHAGSAFMPLAWSLAPIGLDMTISAARRRNWFTPQAQSVFRALLVMLNISLTLWLIASRTLLMDWDESSRVFAKIEQRLLANGAQPTDTLMIANPPGYFLVASRSAISIPYPDSQSVFAVAARYQARYLALQQKNLPDHLAGYISPNNDFEGLSLIFYEPGLSIYEFVPKK